MKNKKELAYVIIIVLLLGVCAQLYYSRVFLPERQVQIFYNKDKNLNKEIIKLAREADKYVYFAIYTFTMPDIKDSLLGAKYRGLKVVGLTDKNQMKSLESQKKIIEELREAGIPVYEQDHSGIMHMKVILTDKAYASGSYNWTSAATNLNDEVLEVGTDEKLRQSYLEILKNLFSKYGEIDYN